jgi:hypothetical protein
MTDDHRQPISALFTSMMTMSIFFHTPDTPIKPIEPRGISMTIRSLVSGMLVSILSALSLIPAMAENVTGTPGEPG